MPWKFNPFTGKLDYYPPSTKAGQMLYDAIVAPEGGDYSSVATACATESEGATIFVRSGTYIETANIVMKNGQRLIGENRYNTIIDFNNAAYQISAVNLADGVKIENLTIKNSAHSNGAIYASGSPYCHFKSLNILAGTTITHGIYYTGKYTIVEDCYITGFKGSTHYGIAFLGDSSKIYGNYFYNNYRALRSGAFNVIVGNIFDTFSNSGIFASCYSTITGNYFNGQNNAVYFNGEAIVVSGNWFSRARVYMRYGMGVVTGNFFSSTDVVVYGSDLDSNHIISDNFFKSGSRGIEVWSGGKHIITGNTFKDITTVCIEIGSSSKYCQITGNNFANEPTEGQTIIDSGTANMIWGNHGLAPSREKYFNRVQNTSGVALSAGNVVILKATATGYEITTTTIAGDDKVFGILEEDIAVDGWGYVQTLGKTTKLKVNGTTPIAIGDFLATYTEAGISAKAGAGDMAFAIALEAYDVADSAGVIDALLITPRKI